MNTYGLLPTGFVPKPLQQIKLELEQAFQSMEKLAENMLEGLPGKSILQRIAVITGIR